MKANVKAKKKRVVDVVAEEFDKMIASEKLEYELVDVEFVKEGAIRFLRVYIDKEGGVDLNDCEKVSRYLNATLDKLDPIEENYMLEVSSAGIERPLKKEKDFIRFAGKLIQIKLFYPIDAMKTIEGILGGFEDGEVIITEENSKKIYRITMDKISNAKLLFRFE